MSAMTIQEAIKARHTVRKFIDKPISAELVALLEERISSNNEKHNLNMALVTDAADGFGVLAKLIGKGARNYLVLAGPDSPDLEEKLGYCGTDVMLYAQTLGLNTWWIGGMFNVDKVMRRLSTDSVKVNSIIGIGYGANQGKQHKMKTAQQISKYNGEPPQWFIDGVDAVLLAPTAINRMAYTIEGDGDKVSMRYAPGPFSDVDLGIGKYHFEVVAGVENFEWV